MRRKTADRAVKLTVLVSGAIIVGIIGVAIRTGHLLSGNLIFPSIAIVCGITYYISRRGQYLRGKEDDNDEV